MTKPAYPKRPGIDWKEVAHAAISALAIASVGFLLALAISQMSGCAVGRRETDGAIVLGFEAGKLAETGDQIIAAGGQSILSLLGMGAGPAGAIGLVAAKLWKDAETEKAKRYAEAKGWEEAKKDSLTQYGAGVVLPPAPASPSPAPGASA